MRLGANWFAPTLTAACSALIGSLWIARAGLTPWAAPPAATWPLVGLAALFVLAKAVAAGTLLFIDNAVAAEGTMLRVEAAQLMASAVPPAPGQDDNAAPLYLRAFAALAADEPLGEAESAFWSSCLTDAGSPEVSAILERHAATLDLLRRATDKPGCRFDRDWSRPALDMVLNEVQEMRQAARLLVLAARRAAADGDGAGVLADIVRVHRLGIHVASDPLLASGLVGQAIDAVAIQTLAEVLPLLDGDALCDFVATPITHQRAFLGEEAIGMATLGDLADGVDGMCTLEGLRAVSVEPTRHAIDGPFSFLDRCFMLPSDIAGYRDVMRRCHDIVGTMLLPKPQPYPTVVERTAAIDDTLRSRRAGVFAALVTPALSGVIRFQSQAEAFHDVAAVLVAATLARLAGQSLGDSLVPEALTAVPGEPFTEDEPLHARSDDDGWVVYSVGPDGEDDGGPAPAGVDADEGNDDVGLRLAP